MSVRPSLQGILISPDGRPLGRARQLAERKGVYVAPKRKQSLPDWIEASVVLPEGVTAKPGAMRLFAYQRGICKAIGDQGD